MNTRNHEIVPPAESDHEDDYMGKAMRWLEERGLVTSVPDTPENWRRTFSPEAREDSFAGETLASMFRPADEEEAKP